MNNWAKKGMPVTQRIGLYHAAVEPHFDGVVPDDSDRTNGFVWHSKSSIRMEALRGCLALQNREFRRELHTRVREDCPSSYGLVGSVQPENDYQN